MCFFNTIFFTRLSQDDDESTHILTVNIIQKPPERAIIVAMSGFTYSFALDYMLSILDVTAKAFTFPEESTADSRQPTVQLVRENSTKPIVVRSPSKANSPEIVNVVQIELNKIEVIMLESLEVPDAPACVFNCHASISVRLDSGIDISGTVSRITMGVANYLKFLKVGKLEEYIMAPTDLTITGTIKGDNERIACFQFFYILIFVDSKDASPKDLKQDLKLVFGHINISISPQMVNTILGILASLGSSKKQNGAEIHECCSTDGLLEPKPIDRNVWYFNAGPPVAEALEASLISTDFLDTLLMENLITIRIPSINVLIKSSGMHSQPLFKFSNSFSVEIINNQLINFICNLTANYFNTGILAWEPFIEPINREPFTIKGELDLRDACTKISIESLDTMEILLTKSSISALNVISTAFTSALTYQAGSVAHFQNNRVIIRNSLGVAMAVDLVRSSIVPSGDTPLAARKSGSLLINVGEEVFFTAENMAKVELFVNVHFNDSVAIERKIDCSNNSTR